MAINKIELEKDFIDSVIKYPQKNRLKPILFAATFDHQSNNFNDCMSYAFQIRFKISGEPVQKKLQ